MTDQTSLEKAVQAIQSGDNDQGRRLLADVLAANPKDDQAWLWLARCVPDDDRKRYCLEKALLLQPDNQEARQALEDMTPPAAPADSAQPEEEPSSQPPSAAGDPVAPSPEAPHRPLADRPAKPVAQTKNSRMSCLQVLLLLFLALVAAGAIIGGLLFILQTGQPGAPNALVQAGALTTPQVFALPPTWTTTPSLVPSPTFFRPTATLSDTPTPIPSVTPPRNEWSLVIGRSVENRPIEVIRFGTGPSKRLIVAGIHGRAEGNTIALADQLIEHLQNNPDMIPDEVTLYILRAFNPDGEAAGTPEDGRLNANGVDLNRNFEANWKAEWPGTSCASPAGSAGDAPASEPETRALMKFLLGRQVEVLVSYHSAGLGVFPSGSPPDPGSVELARAINEVSGYAYPPVKTDCEYTGTLVDWAAQNGARAAVDLELNDNNQTELDKNLKVLDLLLNWQIPTFISPTETLSVTQPITPSVTLSPTSTVRP